MQTFTVTASCHQSSCKLIDDNDFVFRHNIVYVASHNNVRLKRLDYMVVQCYVRMVVQVIDSEQLLGFGGSLVRQGYGFNLNVYRIILFWHQLLHKAIGSIIQLCRLLSLS
ncbi:hypothetical protein D3C77_465630 [compost metagenome]